MSPMVVLVVFLGICTLLFFFGGVLILFEWVSKPKLPSLVLGIIYVALGICLGVVIIAG